jgi:hypothetical protein
MKAKTAPVKAATAQVTKAPVSVGSLAYVVPGDGSDDPIAHTGQVWSEMWKVPQGPVATPTKTKTAKKKWNVEGAGISSSWVKMAKHLAENDDVKGLQLLYKKAEASGKNLPKSKAYIYELANILKGK